MTTKTELLKCPFCNGAATEKRYESCNFIQCQICFATSRGDLTMEESAQAWNTRARLEAPQVEQHNDDIAIDIFAEKMKRKMKESRLEGRWGWRACTQWKLSELLRQSVEKGDPVDVANFCMMLGAEEKISKPPQVESEPVAWMAINSNGFPEKCLPNDPVGFPVFRSAQPSVVVLPEIDKSLYTQSFISHYECALDDVAELNAKSVPIELLRRVCTSNDDRDTYDAIGELWELIK